MKVAGNIECFSGELLRWAAKRPHDYLKDTGFERHSDEVLVGRTKHGFVWLDVWFDVTGTAGIAPVQKRTIVYVGCGLRSKLAGIDCEGAFRQREQQYGARWALWAERQMKAALLDC